MKNPKRSEHWKRAMEKLKQGGNHGFAVRKEMVRKVVDKLSSENIPSMGWVNDEKKLYGVDVLEKDLERAKKIADDLE